MAQVIDQDTEADDGNPQIRMELVANVPPAATGGRYPETDFFDINVDGGEVTCPAGEVTTDARPTTDHKGRPA